MGSISKCFGTEFTFCGYVCLNERLTFGHAVQHHVNEDVRASPAGAIAVGVTETHRGSVRAHDCPKCFTLNHSPN